MQGLLSVDCFALVMIMPSCFGHWLCLARGQVVDERAQLQLGWLDFATRLPKLKDLDVGISVSRTCTAMAENQPAASAVGPLDWLKGCTALQTLTLGLRVPRDAARSAHLHLQGLSLVRKGCKVRKPRGPYMHSA